MKRAIYVLVLLLVPLAAHSQSNLRTEHGAVKAGAAPPAATVSWDGNTIRVQCGNPAARVKTIAAGLKMLGDARPATLLISGTCHENVVITSLDHLTLQGNPTATIDGGSDPNFDTVDIVGSFEVSLVNLTITGGGAGVACLGQSVCELIETTVQNSLGDGVFAGVSCHVSLQDAVVQDNGGNGVSLGAGSVNFFGGAVTGNAADGVSVRNGGYLGVSAGNVYPTVTIQGNAGNGITAQSHSTLALSPASITGNGGDGVSLQGASEMTTLGSSITNNAGHQVRIGDLSFARFAGFQSNTITGSHFPDVVCDPQFSATRQFGNLVGASTNCPAELPPTP
jgi:hypothetical protein